ncbi:MAG: hypothetical protein MMC33_003035 [Icmadophila ericetorum]|nr:hypothetical protein [Icmadophila ericetorum]
MLKNSKNSLNNRKGNSFELLDGSNGNDSITVQTTSARGRPLKRTQPFEPNSPPRAKRANSTKATTQLTAPTSVDTDQWAQVKAVLTRIESALLAAEHRAEKAEKRMETLEEFIRNELFPRINTPPPREQRVSIFFIRLSTRSRGGKCGSTPPVIHELKCCLRVLKKAAQKDSHQIIAKAIADAQNDATGESAREQIEEDFENRT